MSDRKKNVREWFINLIAGYRCEINENGIGLTGNEIHVVEASALESMTAQRDHWCKKYGQYVDKWNVESAARRELQEKYDARTARVDDLIKDLRQESEWHKQARKVRDAAVQMAERLDIENAELRRIIDDLRQRK